MPARDRTKLRARPRQARAVASVEAILGAAAELFGERGVAGTTTDRIAARAGVNVSLVYRYFASKDAIVGALLDRAIDDTEAALASALEATRGQRFEARLRVVLHAVATVPPPALHRVLVEQVTSAKRGRALAALRRRVEARFDALLTEHAPENGTPSEAARFLVPHLLEAGVHAAALARPDGLPLEPLLDELAATIAGRLARAR